MKALKKNQIIVYVIALMLVTAGYLNFTANETNMVETSTNIDAINTEEIAGIGDATLVSSNDVIEENTTNNNTVESSTNSVENTLVENNTKESTTSETSATTTEDNYFANSKLERSTMYSQMIETYEKILSNATVSETQKTVATQEITKINETQNSIMICENLISTKGFKNSVIFVNGESISVIVDSEELKQEEIAQIQNIISREMKAEIDNIHITNK